MAQLTDVQGKKRGGSSTTVASNMVITLEKGGQFEAWTDVATQRTTLDIEDLVLLSQLCRSGDPPPALSADDARLERLISVGLLVRDQAKHVDNSPVFVLGAPRSGTTLVRQILDSHPRISCGSESMFLSVFREIFRNGRIRRPVLNFGIRDEEILEMFKAFTSFVHGQLAGKNGKRRWADKTPAYSWMPDFVWKIFGPEAKYVLLLRHGLDVAVSMSKMVDDGYWDGNLAGFAESRVFSDNPLESGARVWALMNDALHRFWLRRRNLVHCVRYEDLVRDPGRVVEGLLSYLNESVPPGFLEKVFDRELERGTHNIGGGDPKLRERRQIDATSVGRWRDLDKPMLASLADIVNPMLQAWRYDPIPTDPAPGPEWAEGAAR
jgi:protein-tyrosine sulfotransferase